MADLYRPYGEGLLSEEPTRFEDMYAPAATGLLFAPGAGVADLMGQAPDPSRPGEMLPSFYENVTGGNYLDAGLQALGGAGDAVQMMGAAFPPALAVGAAMKAPRGIRAFHGSPHHFERFDTGMIGAGEGSQAYGQGLYFAENENVAEEYKRMLSPYSYSVKGDEYQINPRDLYPSYFEKQLRGVFDEKNISAGDDLVDEAIIAVQEGVLKNKTPMEIFKGRKKEVLDDLQKDIDQATGPEYIKRTTEFKEQLAKEYDEIEGVLSSLDLKVSPQGGAMYEVNIDADPDMMLDHQLPFKDQSEGVKKALEKLGYKPEDERTPGFLIYDRMTQDRTKPISDAPMQNRKIAQVQASKDLAEAGIPGIKYLDAGSRTAAGFADAGITDATRNFVVFDDSLIEIMRKYGLLAPLVGAGTVAAVSDMGEDRGLLEM